MWSRGAHAVRFYFCHHDQLPGIRNQETDLHCIQLVLNMEEIVTLFAIDIVLNSDAVVDLQNIKFIIFCKNDKVFREHILNEPV